jgi:hypothetical protein
MLAKTLKGVLLACTFTLLPALSTAAQAAPKLVACQPGDACQSASKPNDKDGCDMAKGKDACGMMAPPPASPTAGQGDGATITQTRLGGRIFSDFMVPTSPFALQAFEIRRARVYADALFNDTWSGSIVSNVGTLSYDKNGNRTTSISRWPSFRPRTSCLIPVSNSA